MDKLSYTKILNREEIVNNIIEILQNFNNNKNDLSIKRGIYIYGDSGIGKTFLIDNILKSLNMTLFTLILVILEIKIY